MLKAGSETGSFVNHIMSTGSVEPEVGMGCTILMWTDRHAATIVGIHRTPKRIRLEIQEDIATRVDKNGMSESQEYTYERNPNATVQIFKMTKKGWRGPGGGLLIGHRESYHDYSF